MLLRCAHQCAATFQPYQANSRQPGVAGEPLKTVRRIQDGRLLGLYETPVPGTTLYPMNHGALVLLRILPRAVRLSALSISARSASL